MDGTPGLCVVNVAVDGPGRDWCERGQHRLDAALTAVGFSGPRLLWTGRLPPGSPTHEESPYAFKVFALLEAFRRGHRRVLWLDASVVPLGPLDPVEAALDAHGCFLLRYGNLTIGPWSSDRALAALGLDRDEAFDVPKIIAGAIGLDLADARAQQFLRRWHAHALDGVTFPGAYTNEHGQVSADPRVRGHRHDQVAASVLAWRLGMPLSGSAGGLWVDDPAPPRADTLLLCRRACPANDAWSAPVTRDAAASTSRAAAQRA